MEKGPMSQWNILLSNYQHKMELLIWMCDFINGTNMIDDRYKLLLKSLLASINAGGSLIYYSMFLL